MIVVPKSTQSLIIMKMTSDGLKIKAVLTQEGNIIPINYRKDYYVSGNS